MVSLRCNMSSIIPGFLAILLVVHGRRLVANETAQHALAEHTVKTAMNKSSVSARVGDKGLEEVVAQSPPMLGGELGRLKNFNNFGSGPGENPKPPSSFAKAKAKFEAKPTSPTSPVKAEPIRRNEGATVSAAVNAYSEIDARAKATPGSAVELPTTKGAAVTAALNKYRALDEQSKAAPASRGTPTDVRATGVVATNLAKYRALDGAADRDAEEEEPPHDASLEEEELPQEDKRWDPVIDDCVTLRQMVLYYAGKGELKSKEHWKEHWDSLKQEISVGHTC